MKSDDYESVSKSVKSAHSPLTLKLKSLDDLIETHGRSNIRTCDFIYSNLL